ncbi:unnamed protein product [Colias eurytheme]|nr:unnamed protein product [Colias eurytheme]
MEKRVQAQRKFASSIQITNTRQAQQASMERRVTTPQELKVYQVHTTASSILDIVSFQGIHTHQQNAASKRVEKTASYSKVSENRNTEPRYQLRGSKSRKLYDVQRSESRCS